MCRPNSVTATSLPSSVVSPIEVWIPIGDSNHDRSSESIQSGSQISPVSSFERPNPTVCMRSSCEIDRRVASSTLTGWLIYCFRWSSWANLFAVHVSYIHRQRIALSTSSPTPSRIRNRLLVHLNRCSYRKPWHRAEASVLKLNLDQGISPSSLYYFTRAAASLTCCVSQTLASFAVHFSDPEVTLWLDYNRVYRSADPQTPPFLPFCTFAEQLFSLRAFPAATVEGDLGGVVLF